MKPTLFTTCFLTLFFLFGGLPSFSFAHQKADPILCAHVKEGFDTVDTRIVISNDKGIIAEGGFTDVCVSDKEGSRLRVSFQVVGEHRGMSTSVTLDGAGMDVFISQSDGDVVIKVSFVPRTSP